VDVTLQRLTVNAIWKSLRRNMWRGPRSSTRRLSDYGNQPHVHAIARGNIPRARSLNDTIRQNDRTAIAATLEPDNRNNLHARHHVVLERTAYTALLAIVPTSTREELARALHPDNHTPDPYAWDQNGRGEHHLLRVYDPFLTPRVYAFLDALALGALVWPETDEPPAPIRDWEVRVSTRRETSFRTAIALPAVSVL